MLVEFVINNYLGEFHSEEMEIDHDEYKKLLEVSKSYYLEDTAFEMWLKNGFMLIPPEIKKKSILTINIIKDD